MLCVDDNYGLAFNGRRQSRDREVLEEMLRLSGKCRIWMAPESVALFALPELTAVLETNGFPSDKLQVDKNFLSRQKPENTVLQRSLTVQKKLSENVWRS